MPSSYTSSLRLTLPATGELAGQWGNTVNTGITELVDASIAGTTTISTWGGAGVAYTLTNSNGVADEARRMVIVATGAPGEAKNVICPAVSKLYVFRNDTTGGFALTLKTAAGAGIAVAAGQSKLLYCNGTDVFEVVSTNSVKDFGAKGDGTTNDYTAISNAISSVSAAGGGVVYFPSGNYRTDSSITLPSNVYLSGYGATISWGGGASAVITTAATGYTYNAGIEGLTINGSTTATKILELYSTYHCAFRDLTLTSTSTTNTCIDMRVNTSGGTNPDGNRNNVFNLFDNILQEGTCGTAVKMTGDVTVPTVVTLNTFVNFNCRGGAAVRGIDFAEWADSNYFAGITRINLPSTATGAVGVEWNSAAPAANNGVYSNNFDHLAVDTFGAGTGRVGIKMNLTKLNKLGYFFNDPVAEGGDIVVTANTYGYDIVHAIGGTNSTAHKVQSQNYAAGGSYSDSYSIYTNAFTLTGTNQASIVAADAFTSSGTGTCAGITLSNQTSSAAYTMAGYFAVNISNITKNGSASITTQAGVYIADLTSGTNNYAIQSVVTPGTNKWGLFLNGGARNFLGGGGVEVAAGTTSMTAGFVHVPSAAGVPTGAPTNPTGNVPLYYDSTNNRLYAYNGSWRSVALT